MITLNKIGDRIFTGWRVFDCSAISIYESTPHRIENISACEHRDITINAEIGSIQPFPDNENYLILAALFGIHEIDEKWYWSLIDGASLEFAENGSRVILFDSNRRILGYAYCATHRHLEWSYDHESPIKGQTKDLCAALA